MKLYCEFPHDSQYGFIAHLGTHHVDSDNRRNVSKMSIMFLRYIYLASKI